MIYTVTFNPALDYVVRMEHFSLGQVNRTRSEEIQFGGKGINVSTVLKNLGVKSCALGFVAGFTGRALEDGLLTLNFSEQYGGLADISLTLADYCLVLTLSQVEGVDTVQIQSAGHTYHSRSHQTMKADEVLTDQNLPEEVLHPSDEEN